MLCESPYFCLVILNFRCMKEKKDDLLLAKVTVLGEKRVILDCDVADFLETSTYDILQAVKENLLRFDSEDLLLLEDSRWQRKLKETERFYRFPKSKLPVFAFSADGMLTLATVLQSDRAHVLSRMLVKSYSTIVDLRYVLQQMSLTDDGEEQRQLMGECSSLLNQILGISNCDGTSSVSFKVRQHIGKQPIDSSGYFKLMEENERLVGELEESNRRLQELNRGIFRNKGVS